MKLKRILSTSIVLGVMLLVSSIGVTVAETSTAQTLTIGFIGASSGSQMDRDMQLYQAAVLAAEEINAGSDDDVAGISGPSSTRYDLNVTYYKADTSGDAITAVSDAENDNAVAILGPHESDLAQSIVDDGRPDVPILLGAADSPKATHVFRLAANYDDWAKAAANYLVDERKFTRIAVDVANTDTALNGIKTFKSAVSSSLIVADLQHSADKQDFSSDAKTIRDSQAQALFVWTLNAPMLSLLDALKTNGWSGVIVYAGLDSSFLAVANNDQANGLIGPAAWASNAYDSASQKFVADYTTRWGSAPSDAAAVYYDAVYLLASAITSAGDSPSSIASKLSSVDYTGVAGIYENGTTHSLLMVQVQPDNSLMEAARYEGTVCTTCPDTWWTDTTDKTVNKSATFTLGLIATLDGPSETTGTQIEDAARLAIREINDAGGVIGKDGIRYTLNLRTYSVTTADDAKTAYAQALTDGASVVLGPDFNSQIIPNLQDPAASKVVQMVSATDSQISTDEPSNYVLQLRSTDNSMIKVIGNYLMNVRGMTRFASVAVRTDYGLNAVETFADQVAADDNSQLVLRLEHDVDETDFAPLAENIASSSAEAVVVWSTQPAATALLSELQKLNWKGVMVYGYPSVDFMTNAASSSVEVLGPVNWWPTAHDWVSQDFDARFKARYNQTPIAQTAAYYDAVYLIGHAIQSSGAKPANIQSWINSQESFTGIQGQYSPDTYGDGELTQSVLILGTSNSQVTELARYNGTTCLVGCN